MSSSMSVFFSTLDLLCCLAEQVEDRGTLAALCLVSREFYQASKSTLYIELRFVDQSPRLAVNGGVLRPIKALSPSNPNLERTKAFYVATSPHPDYLDHWLMDPFNDLVGSIVEQTPMLDTFTFIGAPLSIKTQQSLGRCCPRLKHLSIHFAEFYHLFAHGVRASPAGDRRPYYTLDLSGFANLTTLRLDAIFGIPPWVGWLDNILGLLTRSPALRHLSLSLDRASFRRSGPRSLEGKAGFPWSFPNICLAYAKTGARPLNLRTLCLGLGLLVFAEEGRDIEVIDDTLPLISPDRHPVHLSKLTTFEHLEEIQLEYDTLVSDESALYMLRVFTNSEATWEGIPGWDFERTTPAFGTGLRRWMPPLEEKGRHPLSALYIKKRQEP